MAKRRLFFISIIAFMLVSMAHMQTRIQSPGPDIVVGRNVNMVSGTEFPGGDPYLQRQNEPSMSISSRNALHMLAGANDYRPVNFPESEGELPGQEPGMQPPQRDAWLGVFKSFDGGQSWFSTMLSGCKYNPDDPGTSPLYGLSAAADPTVRSGPNGMFYYSGIAFDRIKNGRSVYFISRFIDNNNLGYIEVAGAQGYTSVQDISPNGIQDCIDEVDTQILYEGTSGQFTDKPWIAVDKPRDNRKVLVSGAGFPDQMISAHNVYCVLSLFMGNLDSENVHNKVLFFRSLDCGNTWEQPIKLSEGERRNQGTIISISPVDGTVYVAWRRFQSINETDAILVCKSSDYGKTFTNPVEVTTFDPFPNGAFDQGTSETSFRTSALPAMTVDHNGTVYVACSKRIEALGWQARIVMSISHDGTTWSDPEPIDDSGFLRHEFMPSLTYAAGKLMLSCIDTRKSQAPHEFFVDDSGNTTRHTIDVWVAEALPSAPGSLTNPTFSPFKQVSRYLYEGENVGEGVQLEQLQFNPPNYPMFMGGTVPFIGDYIDIAPGPMFLPTGDGGWRFNTGHSPQGGLSQNIAEESLDPAIFHVTWTDNRDVPGSIDLPDPSPDYWTTYYPPGEAPSSECDTTGRRNQNIYTSQISEGIVIGSPSNTKPLTAEPINGLSIEETIPVTEQNRTFLVFVKNLTNELKAFQLLIDLQGADLNASFWQFGLPDEEPEYPWISWDETDVKAWIEPYSSLTMTVFVDCVEDNHPDRHASFRVKVSEMEENGNGGWTPIPGGFQGYILLNPDPVNTAMLDDYYKEIHTPILENFMPDFSYYESDLSDLLDLQLYSNLPEEQINQVNPDIIHNPHIKSPHIKSDSIVNPHIRSTNLGDLDFGNVYDLQWNFKNDGNTPSAYSFTPFGEQLPTDPDEYVESQLLIYRISTTPYWGCVLANDPPLELDHHELLVKVDNPHIKSIDEAAPHIKSPHIRSNTFFLAPGESAVVSLRIIERSSQSSLSVKGNGGFSAQEYAKNIGGAVTPQAANTGDTELTVASSLVIVTKSADLPLGFVNDEYFFPLRAFGGTPDDYDDNGTPENPDDDIPIYLGWNVISHPTREVAPGVFLQSDGTLSGILQYDHINHTYPESYTQTYPFTVELQDKSEPVQTVTKELALVVECKVHTITVIAGIGGEICHYDPDEQCIGPNAQASVLVLNGESKEFIVRPLPCWEVLDVFVDGESVWPLEMNSYMFSDEPGGGVRENHTIEAVFSLITYTITPTVDPAEGGSIIPVDNEIEPDGTVKVTCGSDQTFLMLPEEGYRIKDVVVDDESMGSITEYTFTEVMSDHSIHAEFVEIQDWVQRYNNSPVDDNDEASDIAIDSAGNIHVTGTSVGKTTGPDFYTISYDPAGATLKSWRTDGPSHEGDYGNGVTADGQGGVYVTGPSFRGVNDQHLDYQTVKFENSKKPVWEERYDARRNGNDVATAIEYFADGSGAFVLVTGASEDSSNTQSDVLHYDYLTLKYDAGDGSLIWEARYDGDAADGDDEASAMVTDSNGNVYVTGRSQGESSDFDIVTIKYLPDGNPDPSWGSNGVNRFDGEYGNDEASSIALDSAGNVYVAGKSQGSNSNFDYIILKYDPQGNSDQSWGMGGSVRFDGNYDDEAVAIAVHESEGSATVTVTGFSSNSEDGMNNDYVTIRYLPDGTPDPDWGMNGVMKYDGGQDDRAASMSINASGEVYITGKSQKSASNYDYYTIKYDSSGNMAWRARYYHEAFDGNDEATAIAIDNSGNVYVTGRSERTATDFDFATVKYKEYE